MSTNNDPWERLATLAEHFGNGQQPDTDCAAPILDTLVGARAILAEAPSSDRPAQITARLLAAVEGATRNLCDDLRTGASAAQDTVRQLRRLPGE